MPTPQAHTLAKPHKSILAKECACYTKPTDKPADEKEHRTGNSGLAKVV